MYDRLAETEERIVMLPVLQEITINPDGLAVTEQGQHPKVCTRFVLFWGHKQAQADTDTHRHRHRRRQPQPHTDTDTDTHTHTDTCWCACESCLLMHQRVPVFGCLWFIHISSAGVVV